MHEDMHLVTELAIIMISAGIFTVIFKALKQPLILGYIIAGFLVGPHLGLFPQISMDDVHSWSNIGIIFLLFGLGLEFSFKKLMKVGMAAVLMAATQCIGMFVVGVMVARGLGWNEMEGLFLGGMLGMSSTTIIIKAYTDMGLKEKPYAGLIFGSLVVEDLIAVLLMVLLSTMAVSSSFSGSELVLAFAKLVFFLILWFLVGIYVIPTLLKKAKNYLSDEILLLVSIGLCFTMVTLATMAGFSSALGAFVMGSILAATIESEHILKLTMPVKDMFGAVFFVSVGMMIDPAVIAQHWPLILILVVVAMLGILIFSSGGVLLAGKGLDYAVHSGFTLAQIGEFSFIIAGLGVSLGVLRDFIYPVIVAVSVVTTFTTPYMIKLADPVYGFLEKHLPKKILEKLDHPEQSGKVSTAEQNEWKNLMKLYVLRILLYGVMLFAIVVISDLYLESLVSSIAPDFSELLVDWISTALTLLVMIPFLYGMAVNGSGIKSSAGKLLRKKPSVNRWPLLGLVIFRILLAIAFVMVMIASHLELSVWVSLLVVAVFFISFITARKSVKNYNEMEIRFFENLNQKEIHEKKSAPVTSKVKEKMQGIDVNIQSVKLSSDFTYAGKTLREMPFRKNVGVNIVKIQRGGRSILTPSGDEVLFPSDVLVAVGSTEQLALFKKMIADNSVAPEGKSEEFEVEKIILDSKSILTGHTLRESRVRASGCTVISVLKGEEVITNPSPDLLLEDGDVVWIAGEKSAVAWYQ